MNAPRRSLSSVKHRRPDLNVAALVRYGVRVIGCAEHWMAAQVALELPGFATARCGGQRVPPHTRLACEQCRSQSDDRQACCSPRLQLCAEDSMGRRCQSRGRHDSRPRRPRRGRGGEGQEVNGKHRRLERSRSHVYRHDAPHVLDGDDADERGKRTCRSSPPPGEAPSRCVWHDAGELAL